MYLAHYHLKEKPFNISPDSRFLWLSEKHKEALASLKYGVVQNNGFLVLTGDIGTGKTLLINALIRIIDVKVLIATIPDPGLEVMDFFNFLSDEFNLKKNFNTKGDFLIQFKQFLCESYVRDKEVLLIIDEAQRLDHELLEQIRLLSNIELDNRKLINIFFVGQSEFNQMLLDERNRAVRQRITLSCQLDPLTEKETAQYISHRLKLAGGNGDIFGADAIREVFVFSRGYPRLINIISDHALVTGYASGLEKIDAAMIKACGKELQISTAMDQIQKEPSNFSEAPQKSDATGPRQKQPVSVMPGILFILILFFGFIGYLIYDSRLERTSPWKVEEFAPQKNKWILEQQNKMLQGNNDTQEKIQTDQQVEKILPKDKAEVKINVAAPLSREERKKEESLTNELAASRPAGLIANQKRIIYFEHNSNQLPEKAYESLNSIVKFTSQYPDLKIMVEGFTDSYGDHIYNKQLSKFRADIVKNYLIGQGISPSRIDAIGRGAENPLKSNETLEGRKKNRRVEIKIDLQ